MSAESSHTASGWCSARTTSSASVPRPTCRIVACQHSSGVAFLAMMYWPMARVLNMPPVIMQMAAFWSCPYSSGAM